MKRKQELRKKYIMLEDTQCKAIWQGDSCSYTLNVQTQWKDYVESAKLCYKRLKTMVLADANARKKRKRNPNKCKAEPATQKGARQTQDEGHKIATEAETHPQDELNTDERIWHDLKQICNNGKARRQAAARLGKKRYNSPPQFQPQDCRMNSETKATHMSYHAFCKTIRNRCQHHSVISPLYAHQDSIQEVIKERTVAGQKQYIITWTATNMLRRHLPLLKATGYQVAKAEKWQDIYKLYGPRAGRLCATVTLKPRFEPADGNNIPPELIDDFRAKKAGLGHLRLADTTDTRKDANKSNLDKQGHWIRINRKTPPALIHEPHLEKLINIDSMDVVNPDHDIPAQGVCSIKIAPNMWPTDCKKPQLARVYTASGKAFGTLTVERLKMLHRAFTHTQMHRKELHAHFNNPCFEYAVMKLLSRYGHGQAKGNREKGPKQEFSTPEGFVKALADGLNLTTEKLHHH